MADETYRKFHAGRFGPEGMELDFKTKIGGAVASSPKEKEKPKDEENKDEAGNTYKDKETASMFNSQNAFMKD